MANITTQELDPSNPVHAAIDVMLDVNAPLEPLEFVEAVCNVIGTKIAQQAPCDVFANAVVGNVVQTLINALPEFEAAIDARNDLDRITGKSRLG